MTPRTALVTGGAQGIGKAIVLRLLNAGWRVAAADRDGEAGGELLQDCRDEGDLHFVHTDVGDEASVAGCIGRVVQTTGGLDALVNNAGIPAGFGTRVEDLPLAEWSRVMATNLTGCFLTVKHAAPHLRRARGAIVNIASTRALQSERNTEAYSASKGGIVALTHALAMSLGPEVRVNCVSPGWVETGEWRRRSARRAPSHSERDRLQHPVGRVGTPDDIASMVEYLLSEEAGFITGQNFVVDGGMTRKMIYEE